MSEKRVFIEIKKFNPRFLDKVPSYVPDILGIQELKGKRVCITVEELPESKPESNPEKNCGNCGAGHTGCKTEPGKTYCSAWQPKAAEPQGWEQRFDFEYRSFINQDFVFNQIKSFIRAEIERAREEEKNKILETLMETRIRQYDGLVHISRYAWNNVQENKHREGGK